MSLTDIIVLIIVLSLFIGITIFLIVKYKNNPCYGCSFSKKGRKNRLLKAYYKKYKKNKNKCCTRH